MYASRFTALFALALLAGACQSPSGGSASAPSVPSDDAMRADCRAKAAVQYGMPQKTLKIDGAIRADGKGFALPGSVDKPKEGVKTFLCRYGADRTLTDVMATTPDGE